MEEKEYKVDLYYKELYIGRFVVEASSESEARERAWELFETNIYSLVVGIDIEE